MTDVYKAPFADITAFVADGNAINAATKTALNTALTNISNLVSPPVGTAPGHPDFDKIPKGTASKIADEITALKAAVTAHA